ncbi:hypothetical protein MXD95_012815 [Frankia sp. AiPa1]|nr:hypothetical protein [Frankia sp. AiPa1]
MTVRPTNPDGLPGDGFTTGVVRSIQWGWWIAEAKRVAGELQDIVSGEQWVPTVKALLAQRRQAAGRGDEFYAVVAAAFADLSATGTRRATQELAAKVDTPPNTVNRWLKEARSRGLLTSPERGQTGGVPTATAQQLLQNLIDALQGDAGKANVAEAE